MAKLIVDGRFGVIPSCLINDRSVSFKAKGLYAYIQSKPENWDFSADRIASQTKESVDAIRTGLKELEKAGYLLRTKYQQDITGHWKVEYTLYSVPTMENPSQENPTLENPSLENPQTLVKKKNSKKDYSNKDYMVVSEFENILIEKEKYDEFGKIFEKSKLDWIIKKLDSWLETKNKKCKGVKSFKAYCNNWVEESFNDAHKQTYQQQKIVNSEPNKQPNPLDKISGRVTQMYLDADFVKMGHQKAKELFWYIEKSTKKEHMSQTEINFHLFYY